MGKGSGRVMPEIALWAFLGCFESFVRNEESLGAVPVAAVVNWRTRRARATRPVVHGRHGTIAYRLSCRRGQGVGSAGRPNAARS